MKALVVLALNTFPVLQTLPQPQPAKGQVLLKVLASALNHRDVWICKGQYAGIQLPCILGSDTCAETEEGLRVLVNPSLNWPRNSAAQPANYELLGMPSPGSQAESMAVSKKLILPTPTHLSDYEAAALPVAGLTAWRALMTRCQLKKGEKVLITGIGGGVALMGLQFALAAGASVWVSSSSEEKISKAMAMGAVAGVNYSTQDWHKSNVLPKGGFDVILDGAAGPDFEKLVRLCAPGARIGVYGGTRGPIGNISPQILFWKQASILGCTMGSAPEFKKMVAFVQQHEVIPIVDSVFTMEQTDIAFAKMAAGQQFGKIVIKTT